jgi:hypothetical protein
MRKLFVLWCIAAFNIVATPCIKNIEADNWKEVEKIILDKTNNLKEFTLFFVDVDNVLTYTNVPSSSPSNVATYCSLFKAYSAEALDAAWGRVFMNNPQAVLDEYSRTAIKNIQNLGGKIIGLTSLIAGKNEEIIQKRNDMLDHMFGIIPVINRKFSDKSAGIFFNRCITTNGSKIGKSKAARKFLSIMKNKPKVIAFIDDSEKNLENVRKNLPKDYKFVAIHYVGYKKQIPKQSVTREEFEAFWTRYLKK